MSPLSRKAGSQWMLQKERQMFEKAEQQMKALCTKPKVEESDPTPAAPASADFEADFSEPEEISLKGPMVREPLFT